MVLEAVSMISGHLADKIQLRFDARNSDRILTKVEQKKIGVVSELISKFDHPFSVVGAFVDHVFPVTGRFKSVRNIFFEWRTFASESLHEFTPFFPVTDLDTELFRSFRKDWKQLTASLQYFQSVYTVPSKVGSAKFERLYLGTPAFWRLLRVLRPYYAGELVGQYPLFTVRSFLAAQVEALSSFVDRIVVGNLVSEKAGDRYEDWYCNNFYPAELVFKAKKRPSANNPVCTSSIRVEFEKTLNDQRRGDFTFVGDQPVYVYSRPALYEGTSVVEAQSRQQGIVLPPKMRGSSGRQA